MTDNNTFCEDFDWDADTEELPPREFQKAYEQAGLEFPDWDLYEEPVSLLLHGGLKPDAIAEEAPSSSRTTIPNKKFHSRCSVMFEHFLKFFSDAVDRYRLF